LLADPVGGPAFAMFLRPAQSEFLALCPVNQTAVRSHIPSFPWSMRPGLMTLIRKRHPGRDFQKRFDPDDFIGGIVPQSCCECKPRKACAAQKTFMLIIVDLNNLKIVVPNLEKFFMGA
jgi:hypothetical protein